LAPGAEITSSGISDAASGWNRRPSRLADPAALYGAQVLFGLCFGNVLTLPSLIFQDEFVGASFGRLLGLSAAIGQIAVPYRSARV
jgi:hypothetical protein